MVNHGWSYYYQQVTNQLDSIHDFFLVIEMKHYFAPCRYRKAQLALQKGEEDLAREALKRRKTYAVS